MLDAVDGTEARRSCRAHAAVRHADPVLGSVSNDFGVPGASTHPISLDTLRDAERFHRRLLALCVRADGARGGRQARRSTSSSSARARRGRARSGDPANDPRARGVRARLHRSGARHLHHRARSVLAHPAAFVRSRGDRRGRAPEELDVDVRTGQRVTEIDADGVHTASGAFYPGDLVVWAAGIMAPAIQRELGGLETNRGISSSSARRCRTTRDPDIFAFGDCAAAPWIGHKEGAILPPRAQVAHQQATLLAKSIKARLAGKPLPTFRFHDFGSLVSLGELSAVGTLMGR
jgi:NADH dehydrogenase